MYDVIVIGSGPGGYVAAIRAAQLNLKVALVEKDQVLGGTCLNVGCIPSKSLLHSSHLFDTVQKNGAANGIIASELKADLTQMMKRKSEVVKSFNQGISFLMKKNKIDVITGVAQFSDPHTLSVNGESYKANSFIIATGSSSTELPFLPVDEKSIVSSTGALAFSEVPKKLLIVGAGVIGIELGSVYARLGAQVEVIEFLDRICPTLDLDISKAFQKILEAQGFTFHLSTKVESATGTTLHTSNGDYSADKILVAVGRKPNSQNLGLDFTTDKHHFITINERFQTNYPHIYAIGDVAGGPLLAHKASEEGIAVAELIAGQSPHLNYATIPSVIYTSPEVASVGFTEEQLNTLNHAYTTQSFPLKVNSRARCVDATEGLVKLTTSAHGQLLGGHIIAEGAGEMIHELTLAIEHRLKTADLATLCHAHPTLSEAIKEAAHPIHQ